MFLGYCLPGHRFFKYGKVVLRVCRLKIAGGHVEKSALKYRKRNDSVNGI